MTQSFNTDATFLGEHVYAYPGSQIDPSVIIDGFTQLWNGLIIKAGVRIGSGVIFLKDDQNSANTCIAEKAIIGAGCIIGAGITIAQGAILEPGSVVLQNVPAHAIVGGNPAKINGYTQTDDIARESNVISATNDDVINVGVNNVTLHRFKLVKDYRGDLSVGEFSKEIPFEPKRYFLVFNVPSEKTRGEHAHYECHQFLICVKGSCSVVADDGVLRREVLLDQPNLGIYLPPLTWGIQYKYSHDAVLLVFASHYYEADDYIRNYEDFLAAIESKKLEAKNNAN
ncbi:MAG: isomerase [Moraxellaceae bacterium]|nr:MAG: isomerase [Moraxellaceae bacterium]